MMDTIWQIVFPGLVVFTRSFERVQKILAYTGPIQDYYVELVFLDYDPDATMCQDDYEYYTRSGQYANKPF